MILFTLSAFQVLHFLSLLQYCISNIILRLALLFEIVFPSLKKVLSAKSASEQLGSCCTLAGANCSLIAKCVTPFVSSGIGLGTCHHSYITLDTGLLDAKCKCNLVVIICIVKSRMNQSIVKALRAFSGSGIGFGTCHRAYIALDTRLPNARCKCTEVVTVGKSRIMKALPVALEELDPARRVDLSDCCSS